MKKRQYNIHLTSQLTGVSIYTLRAWEKRYKIVSPTRSESNRRLYNEEEIEKIRLASMLCQIGYNISEIAYKESSELKTILNQYQDKKDVQRATPGPIASQLTLQPEITMVNLVMALSLYKLDVISHELAKLTLLMGQRKIVFEIVLPLLKEVGIRLAKGELEQSHYQAINSLLRFYMAPFLFKASEIKRKSPYRFLLAMPEGETDELILYLAGTLCVHHQFNFLYAGPNLTSTGLIHLCHSADFTHVLLAKNSNQTTERGGFLDVFLKRLQNKSSAHLKFILLGGSISNDSKGGKLTHCPLLKDLDLFLQNL